MISTIQRLISWIQGQSKLRKIVFVLACSTCIALIFLFLRQYYLSKNPLLFTDKSELTSVLVSAIRTPGSLEELKKILLETQGPISIAGTCYSQGGQTAYPAGTVLDMSRMHKVLAFDPERKLITVEAGATWRDIQEHIDPYNLSVAVMQSYHDFSVGGSLSVNVHARDMQHGSLISTVQSVTILCADGTLIEADRAHHSDLFYGAIGGYGLLGVIVFATFQLTDNVPLERQIQTVSIDDYPQLFAHRAADPSVVFQNADVFPMDFTQALSITWRATTKRLTEPKRLQSSAVQYLPQRIYEVIIRRLSPFRTVRPLVQSLRTLKNEVVLRNFEMSYSTQQLAMHLHFPTTMTLQEYFVPTAKFQEVLEALRSVLNIFSVNVLNLSVRYVPQDTESVLAYAQQDSFAFVLYFNLLNTNQGKESLCFWTIRMIDKILNLGGSYYLPYVLCARTDQFKKAYPRHAEFLALKNKYDPNHTFRNMLWKKYFENN